MLAPHLLPQSPSLWRLLLPVATYCLVKRQGSAGWASATLRTAPLSAGVVPVLKQVLHMHQNMKGTASLWQRGGGLEQLSCTLVQRHFRWPVRLHHFCLLDSSCRRSSQ